MSTYYNYVKRGTESQVNWGKVGTDISDEILRISKDRDQKRQDLDTLNTDLIKSAAEVAIPEQEYLKNLVLNGTNEMKNLSLMNNKLLKNGLITPAQYRMTMENMKSNVANLDKSVKEFAPAYKDAMERLNSGEMPWAEQQQKENLFKYGNLQNKTLYVAPDGNMYITGMDENGNPIADKKNMMNVGVMAQGLGYKSKKYDTLGELAKGVSSIGSVVNIERRGGVLSTDSAMNNPEYKSARDKYISAMMNNPVNLVSIMGDYIGGYNKVDSESESGAKNIFFDSDGVARPTAGQREEVKKFLETQFDSMVKKTATAMPIQQSSGGDGGRAIAKENELGDSVKTFLTGKGAASKAAAQFIGSQNPNIRSLKKENGVIKITMNDGGYQEFDQNEAGTNAEIIGRGFIGFALGDKIPNVNQVLNRSGITPTLNLSFDPITYEYQQGGQIGALSKTQILSPDGKTIVFASNALNQIDPDADVDQEVQAILSQIDPRLSITTQSNSLSKDRLTLFLDGQEVGTIDYDDAKDKVELTKLIDKARGQESQGATQQAGTSSASGGQSR